MRLFHEGMNFQGKTQQVDEASRILLIVNSILAKGRIFLVIEGIRGFDAGGYAVAL